MVAVTVEEQSRVDAALRAIFAGGRGESNKDMDRSVPESGSDPVVAEDPLLFLFSQVRKAHAEVVTSRSSGFNWQKVSYPGEKIRQSRKFSHSKVKLPPNRPGQSGIPHLKSPYKRLFLDERKRVKLVECKGRGPTFVLARIDEPDEEGFATWKLGGLSVGRYKASVGEDGLVVLTRNGVAPATISFKVGGDGSWCQLS